MIILVESPFRMAYFTPDGCLLQPLLMFTSHTKRSPVSSQQTFILSSTTTTTITATPTVTAAAISINRVATTTVGVTSNSHTTLSGPLPPFPVPYHFMSRHSRGGKQNQLSLCNPMDSPPVKIVQHLCCTRFFYTFNLQNVRH
ncbi:hypothetical protein PHAVU_009G031550 [Phaseolus vulgaris]